MGGADDSRGPIHKAALPQRTDVSAADLGCAARQAKEAGQTHLQGIILTHCPDYFTAWNLSKGQSAPRQIQNCKSIHLGSSGLPPMYVQSVLCAKN